MALTRRQKIGCLGATLYCCVVGPIWFYLLYRILEAAGASNVMWLLFWIYVPASFVMGVLARTLESLAEEK